MRRYGRPPNDGRRRLRGRRIPKQLNTLLPSARQPITHIVASHWFFRCLSLLPTHARALGARLAYADAPARSSLAAPAADAPAAGQYSPVDAAAVSKLLASAAPAPAAPAPRPATQAANNTSIGDAIPTPACTANDVRISSVHSYQVFDNGCPARTTRSRHRSRSPCKQVGSDRYDIGIFVATDGGDVKGTGTCYHTICSPSRAPPTSRVAPALFDSLENTATSAVTSAETTACAIGRMWSHCSALTPTATVSRCRCRHLLGQPAQRQPGMHHRRRRRARHRVQMQRHQRAQYPSSSRQNRNPRHQELHPIARYRGQPGDLYIDRAEHQHGHRHQRIVTDDLDSRYTLVAVTAPSGWTCNSSDPVGNAARTPAARRWRRTRVPRVFPDRRARRGQSEQRHAGAQHRCHHHHKQETGTA